VETIIALSRISVRIDLSVTPLHTCLLLVREEITAVPFG
jgi:hypothetical protein